MKRILIILPIVLMLFITGCSDYLDVNTDPNNPTEVDATLVLPAAQAQIASSLGGDYAPLFGIWSQHWTQSNAASQFKTVDKYALTNANYNTPWRELYSDALVDLSFVRNSAAESGNWNLNLQATVSMAYIYQFLADVYGQIPFSEALQGEEGEFTPVFDEGENVYDGLISMIDGALGKDFLSPGNIYIATDFLFGGGDASSQIDGWKRMANTLKLKIYLRQSDARPSIAMDGISDLLDSGLFLNAGAGMSIYSDAPNSSYPIYESMVRSLNVATNLRGSNTLVSYLIENGDSRLDVLFQAGVSGHFGLYQGAWDLPSTTIDPVNVDVAIFDPNNTWWYFSPDEVEFLLAEANLRFGDSGAAMAHYNAGIMKAFSRLDLDGSAFVSGVYTYPNATDMQVNLEAIITQKWIAAVERGHESFFDYNRTGYPKTSSVGGDDVTYIPGQFTYSVTGTTSGNFPQRLIFPDRSTRNNPNAPSDVPLTTPIWWAQ